MDATIDCIASHPPQKPSARSRGEIANTMAEAKGLESPWTSWRQIAGELNVPARSLNYWVHRERTLINNSSWPARTVRFFETPEGTEFLHRLMTAAHLVFVEATDCGLRNLSWFLELTRLSEFVASSYGAQQAVAEELESLLIRFGEEEDAQLATHMPAREITLCEDETFHPQICLVAIEPVSDFIVVEQYQPQRDAATWDQCTGAKLGALPVTVYQVTSDAAKALIAHAETYLGAHHSPDLFHVQYDTVKATGGALASQTQAAVRELEKRQGRTAELRTKGDFCREKGSPDPLVDVLQERAQQAETAARERLEACQSRQKRAQAARQGLGRDYHPVDLQTGQPLTPEEVGGRLTSALRHARPSGGRSRPFGACLRQARQGASRLGLHAGHHRLLLGHGRLATGSVGILSRGSALDAAILDSRLLFVAGLPRRLARPKRSNACESLPQRS